jgi:hypothetical protein
MNTRILLAVVAACAIATGPLPALDADQPVAPAFTDVAGSWFAHHSNWKDTITFRPDGTFSRFAGEGGKWYLTTQEGHSDLHLEWDEWKPDVIRMANPNLFKGRARSGNIFLHRLAGEIPDPKAIPPAKETDDPALRKKLQSSIWVLRDGKQFKLHADGTVTSSWNDRKGSWQVIGPDKLNLTISTRAVPVSVESNACLLRWSDADWGELAKRLAAVVEEPSN